MIVIGYSAAVSVAAGDSDAGDSLAGALALGEAEGEGEDVDDCEFEQPTSASVSAAETSSVLNESFGVVFMSDLPYPVIMRIIFIIMITIINIKVLSWIVNSSSNNCRKQLQPNKFEILLAPYVTSCFTMELPVIS